MTSQNKILIKIISFLLLFSCSKKNESTLSSDETKISATKTKTETKDSETSQKQIKKVDGSTLVTRNITIAKLMVAKATGYSVSYELDGRADYAQVTICPLDQDIPKDENGNQNCPSDVSLYNRVRVPPLWPGRVEVRVQSCVESEHLTSSTACGAPAVREFTVNGIDPKIIEILNKKEVLRKRLLSALQEYQNLTKKFMEDLKDCEVEAAKTREYIEGKKKILEDFVYAPAEFISGAASDVVNGIFGEGSTGKLISGASDAWHDFSKKVGDKCYSAFKMDPNKLDENPMNLCAMTGSLVEGLLGQVFLLPESVGVFSSAVVDVLAIFKGDTDKIVAKVCRAEEDYSLHKQSIDQLVGTIKVELTELKAQYDKIAPN